MSQHARDILDEIAAERSRQEHEEGWSSAHDDAYERAELPRAAAGFLIGFAIHSPWGMLGEDPLVSKFLRVSGYPLSGLPRAEKLWPWDTKWFKAKSIRRALIKAASLIVAEIERIDRKAAKEKTEAGIPAASRLPKKGDRVRYHGLGGYPHDREAANKMFYVGQLLHVIEAHVDDYRTDLVIGGPDGSTYSGSYNSVLFAIEDEVPEEPEA